MASPDIFTRAAQQFLCSGTKKKRLCPSACVDLAAQVLAVDAGLKPALLYDTNAASPEQIQLYLDALQTAGRLSKALRTVSIDDNSFVVNPALEVSHMEDLLKSRSLVVIDVCPQREKPGVTDFNSEMEDMVTAMLEYFKDLNDAGSARNGDLDKELYQSWNLCTLFGVLLGYPVSYWFDQTRGFENCLSMTPLVVTKVWVTWRADTVSHRCCLYSFSVPEELWSDAQSQVDRWTQGLSDRIRRQAAFTELSVSMTTVTLPAVTL
ncbi:UPF0739 protein C1orf74 homolog [Chanos chanos]|uniref:UPF0739 protein C1orf74 homolog n=1 Tax=Chanos chanos TaxID=29144 RepID=A0A6J2VML3_CHACN|nr:UPF0739 protein C1orf74 homolog [Chanos chanos]